MKTYYIYYNTGAGDITITGTLDDAMNAADSGAAYTQTPITIEDDDGNEIARREWCGVEYDPDEDYDEFGVAGDIIQFGSFGFYDRWHFA